LDVKGSLPKYPPSQANWGKSWVGRNLVVHAHDAPFEQRPNILDPIDMDTAMNVALGLVDGFVGKLGAIKPEIECLSYSK
jgi:hypothetical protein